MIVMSAVATSVTAMIVVSVSAFVAAAAIMPVVFIRVAFFAENHGSLTVR